MAAFGLASVTAFEGLRRLGNLNERSIAVTGAAGGVGSAAVALAKAEGAQVIGIISGPSRPNTFVHSERLRHTPRKMWQLEPLVWRPSTASWTQWPAARSVPTLKRLEARPPARCRSAAADRSMVTHLAGRAHAKAQLERLPPPNIVMPHEVVDGPRHGAARGRRDLRTHTAQARGSLAHRPPLQ